MTAFAMWLGTTGISQYFQQTLWVIPAVQSVHIMAIAAVLTSTLFINLSLLRLSGSDVTLVETADRFLNWIWGALAVLLGTGTLLVIAEPERELLSVPFWIKMGLILIGIAATLWFARRVQGPAAGRLPDQPWVRLYAFGTLLVWVCVITAGRLIAYIY